MARRDGADQVAHQRVEDRLVDRLPAEGEIAEGLAHPVDVTSPVVLPGALVDEPALVVAEPTGQGEVVQAAPDANAGVLRGSQDVAVVLDGTGVVLSRRGLEARPFE